MFSSHLKVSFLFLRLEKIFLWRKALILGGALVGLVVLIAGSLGLGVYIGFVTKGISNSIETNKGNSINTSIIAVDFGVTTYTNISSDDLAFKILVQVNSWVYPLFFILKECFIFKHFFYKSSIKFFHSISSTTTTLTL